jgi:hypothetical protein
VEIDSQGGVSHDVLLVDGLVVMQDLSSELQVILGLQNAVLSHDLILDS